MDSYTSNVYMGILEIVGLQGGPDSVLQAAVVLENEVVVDSLPDVPSAFAVLFGLIYVLASSILQVGSSSLKLCKGFSYLWMPKNAPHAFRD